MGVSISAAPSLANMAYMKAPRSIRERKRRRPLHLARCMAFRANHPKSPALSSIREINIKKHKGEGSIPHKACDVEYILKVYKLQEKTS